MWIVCWSWRRLQLVDGEQAAPALKVEGLWLDGSLLVEMTPQELELLTAIAPHCGEVTLAFCLDREQADANDFLAFDLVGD